jgi:hypothetical protein
LNNGAIAVSDSGNVYVGNSWNEGFWLFGAVFKVTPDGVITEIFGGRTTGVAVDGADNVYVASPCNGYGCVSRAFKITPDGETTMILDSDGDGVNYCGYPGGIAAHGSGTVYITSTTSNNAFKIAGICLADIDGDGTVGITDFLDLLAAWGPHPAHRADLDGDGTVGIEDLLALLATWGPCP